MNVSFFIPAFNCATTVEEAIDSILKSNFESGDELIIVNDFSVDDTADVLRKAKDNYPFIIIIDHKRNKGGAAARNTAVENAKNELLFCLDSDNVLAPETVQQLKKYLVDNNADVASFQYQHCFTGDKLSPQYTYTLPAGEFDMSLYYKGENTPGQHGNYLFTKQSWIKAKGYAEGTGALDTWTFGLRQAISGAKTVILKDTHYYHRLNYDSSYWMRDAESNLWSVSVKAAHALFPFYEQIDEKFLTYMFGRGRYGWFHNLKYKNLKLVEKGSKQNFYKHLHEKLIKFIYPKASLFSRAIKKTKRTLAKP